MEFQSFQLAPGTSKLPKLQIYFRLLHASAIIFSLWKASIETTTTSAILGMNTPIVKIPLAYTINSSNPYYTHLYQEEKHLIAFLRHGPDPHRPPLSPRPRGAPPRRARFPPAAPRPARSLRGAGADGGQGRQGQGRAGEVPRSCGSGGLGASGAECRPWMGDDGDDGYDGSLVDVGWCGEIFAISRVPMGRIAERLRVSQAHDRQFGTVWDGKQQHEIIKLGHWRLLWK